MQTVSIVTNTCDNIICLHYLDVVNYLCATKLCSCVFQKEMLLQTAYILVLSLISLAASISVDSSLFRLKANIPKKCSYLKNHNMMAVDCYGLDLTAVPQNLRTDIEVCLFFKLNLIWVSWVRIWIL
jgi:hypothetical protein